MTEDEQVINVLSGHVRKISDLEFRRNHLWSISEGGVIRVWDVNEKSMPCIKELTSTNELKLFSIIHVGDEMWTSGFTTVIEVWDALELKYKKTIETEHKDAIVLLKGWNQAWAVSWDGCFSVWT